MPAAAPAPAPPSMGNGQMQSINFVNGQIVAQQMQPGQQQSIMG